MYLTFTAFFFYVQLIYYQNNDKMAKGIKKGKQKWNN